MQFLSRNTKFLLKTSACFVLSIGGAFGAAKAGTNMPDVASEMTALYNIYNQGMCPYDGSNDPDLDRPAFMCSGILIRTATNDPNNRFFVWDLAPSSTAGTGALHTGQGGVSFSWIRKDITFRDLGNSGYTLYPSRGPYALKASGKITPKVLCGFPMDGWTNYRADAGCGPGINTQANNAPIAGGRVCQDENILQGVTQWVDHYENPPAGTPQYFWQCGFDLYTSAKRPGGLKNGQAFQQWMYARGRMEQIDGDRTFQNRNELRIEDWPAGTDPRAIPIQSFYYVVGNAAGRADAQKSQLVYHQKTGIAVPVVQISVPTMRVYSVPYNDPRILFTFKQLPSDQVI